MPPTRIALTPSWPADYYNSLTQFPQNQHTQMVNMSSSHRRKGRQFNHASEKWQKCLIASLPFTGNHRNHLCINNTIQTAPLNEHCKQMHIDIKLRITQNKVQFLMCKDIRQLLHSSMHQSPALDLVHTSWWTLCIQNSKLEMCSYRCLSYTISDQITLQGRCSESVHLICC